MPEENHPGDACLDVWSDTDLAAQLHVFYRNGQYQTEEAQRLKEELGRRILTGYAPRLRAICSRLPIPIRENVYDSFAHDIAVKILSCRFGKEGVGEPAISSFDPDMPFENWLFAMTYNETRDIYKTYMTRKVRPESDFSQAHHTDDNERSAGLLENLQSPQTYQSDGDSEGGALNKHLLVWLRCEASKRSSTWHAYVVLYMLVKSRDFDLRPSEEEKQYFLEEIIHPENAKEARLLLSRVGVQKIAIADLARLMIDPKHFSMSTFKSKQNYVSQALSRVREQILQPWFDKMREDME